MKKKISIVFGAVLLSASMASAVVIDNYDGTDGWSYNSFRSAAFTSPDTLNNNTGDTRGGQLITSGTSVDVSSLGFADADGSDVVMSIALTENIGNELPGIGQIMVADGADRRWIFYFDNFSTGSALGSPATVATSLTLTSNASSGRKSDEGTNDGADFDWSSFSGTWMQIFATQTGGGAHPIDLTFDTMEVIPEPATLGLVAVFGGAVLFIRRRLMM